jgi:hypothetical protein
MQITYCDFPVSEERMIAEFGFQITDAGNNGKEFVNSIIAQMVGGCVG